MTAEGEIYAGGCSQTVASGLDAFPVKLQPGGEATWRTGFDTAGADDGATALSLGAKGVCLAGVGGESGLMVPYGKNVVTP